MTTSPSGARPFTADPGVGMPSASDWPNARSFIESQFPVSKLSKESYKERKAGSGQTLTGLGKWWGRKPLVLVRAIILGLLLPATADPRADRETFLALMTMDDEGLLRRLRGSVPAPAVYGQCTAREQSEFFSSDGPKPQWTRGIATEEKRRLQRLAFLRMGYDEKLKYCIRPEEIDGPSPDAWARINAHLGTNALSIVQLVRELGQRRFGHPPRVGDAFCGGGSIPFEAARLGCDAYGSDLSPVAALLTWGALNIVGGGQEVVERVQAAQRRVYEAVRKQVDEWGIERNEEGWIADAYLYCNEVLDPVSGWQVPLAPSWVIAEGPRVVARLRPDPATRRFDIEVVEGVNAEEVKQAKAEGTWRDGVRCPVDRDGAYLVPTRRTPIGTSLLRGHAGLRLWERDDLIPWPDDVFQERLYCIRWLDPVTSERHYRAPTFADKHREERVLALLRERFDAWQSVGYVPEARIEPGAKTSDLIGMRGWTHWHHPFNPRHLLLGGLLVETTRRIAADEAELAGLLLSTLRTANWSSRLSGWNTSIGKGGGIGVGEAAFFNPSLIPLANYSCRTARTLESTIRMEIPTSAIQGEAIVLPLDARAVNYEADQWITDPGYADAVRYEELSELFLAWLKKYPSALSGDRRIDSRRALAVKGRDENFRHAMVECYRRFTELMTENGFQVVMFTHQDAEVWGDLALILWASGLQVTAAWTIGTETTGVIHNANEVQGTVLLVLRKRRGELRGDMSDLYPDVQAEVQRQLESMLALDPKEDPNFGDADYQLAAYAAALRVLTGYSAIDEIDIERELYRTRMKGERSTLVGLIERAVRIASDYLVPSGIGRATWRKSSPEERLYLKGIEVEAHGEYRDGVYQEFARGFGVGEYRGMLASGAANQTRLKTPEELKSRDLRGEGFAGSLLRQLLFAVHLTVRDQSPRAGRDYLRQELQDYWSSRQTILTLLRFLARTPSPAMTHWTQDTEAADLLLGLIENDSV